MKKYKLEDLCKEIIDCPHSTPNWKNEGVRVIRNFNIKNGRLDFSDGYFVDEDSYKERTRRAIPEANDLVISREAPMGAVCIIPENLKCCLGQRLVLLKIDNSICDSKYLLFSIQSDYVQKQIEVINKTGSIVSNLNISDLKKLMIPYRSLSVQQKIAAVLSSLDDKIALNNRINAKLEQMAKRLYDYWFVQFDFPRSVSGEPCLHELSRTDDGNARSDFPGADGKPYKSSGGKMVWNEELKREIPEGWEVSRLGEVVELLKDGTHNPPKRQNEGIPLLTGTMFGENFLDYSKATYISQQDYENIHSQYKPKENDVIITKIGTLGNVNLLRNIDIPIAIHCNSALLRFNKNLGTYFPFYYCKSDLFKMRLKAVKGQSIQEFASLDSISSLWSEIPLEEVIKKFECMIKPILEKQISISLENKKLSEMRDKLLPLLMNGQVVVE